MRTDRFHANTSGYVSFRPTYPISLISALADKIIVIRAQQEAPVLDVGSGTGIFSRQLAGLLPSEMPIIGIEPSSAMRARASTDDRVSYQDGTAEALPFNDGAARAVTAATAAHWFNRPLFYNEATRVLQPGGLLAIVEYVRDLDASPAARAVLNFLNEYGEPRAYARPEYAEELQSLDRMGSFEEFRERQVLPLSIPEFIGLALSSSHAAVAVETLGQDQAAAKLASIGEELADGSGKIPFGYTFQMFVCVKTA